MVEGDLQSVLEPLDVRPAVCVAEHAGEMLDGVGVVVCSVVGGIGGVLWYPVRGLMGREGEGDVRHCLCAQEVVWPQRIATGGGLHGPSVLTELAQGARQHPLRTGGKEGPMA